MRADDSGGDVMNARSFWANILGSEFFFNSELLKFSRKQVDKTVFLNDWNCYWQSTCSEEVVHRASFLTGYFFGTSLLVAIEFA